MNKIVRSDEMTAALAEALRARGIEIADDILTEASEEALDNVDEVDDSEDMYDEPDYDDDDPAAPLADGTFFADPGGNSALRAATRGNPRNLPCPSCREPNRLTPADKARGYQCDSCADAAERGY